MCLYQLISSSFESALGNIFLLDSRIALYKGDRKAGEAGDLQGVSFRLHLKSDNLPGDATGDCSTRTH